MTPPRPPAEPTVEVIGGGLAGSEASIYLADRGHNIRLFEMRPARGTPAHQTAGLAELVCTNSLKTEEPTNAHGQLKREMDALGSLVLTSARKTRVAAGSALAVDRNLFSQVVTQTVSSHPRIEVVREERRTLPDGPGILATGPLTSDALATAIQDRLGQESLYFFDAIAPIVDVESLDHGIVFEAGRFQEDSDYLNCPMNEREYGAFLETLRAADVYPGHDWEGVPYFEGCLPVEVMAERGEDTLRFGPMKPIGLVDPRTGEQPHAVVQLRREDRAGQMWNMVGFQTRLRTGEQGRVFRMIPGLEEAEFLRWGSIHRNSFINFPSLLTPWGSFPRRPDLIVAGQLTGGEGYTESAASGLLAGLNLHRILAGLDPVLPPPTTMLGGLYRYLSEADPLGFQPMNSNWGLVDPLPKRIRDRKKKREALAERAQRDFLEWLRTAETGP